MAVNIPVIIDIEKAFDDAARRVDTAVRPLRQEIDRATADLKINVGVDLQDADMRTLKSILDNTREMIGSVDFSMTHLQRALKDVSDRYDALYTKRMKAMSEGDDVSSFERIRLSQLQEAIIALTAEIELRTRGSRLVKQQAQDAIALRAAEEERNFILKKRATTVAQLEERLGALRQKLDNMKPGTKTWEKTAEKIKETTDKLAEYQKRLKEILNPVSEKPSGSIEQIRADMAKLEAQWKSLSKSQKFDANGNLTASAQSIINKYKALTEEARKYQQGVLTKLLATFGTYISLHSLLRFVKQIRDVTGELEYQRVALGHLLQDVEYGNYLFERIKEAAIESPFRIKDLVTYTKQLAAYRIEQNELFDTTKRLADISAGLGVDMNRLILAYGQVRAASVLRGQELRQFTEAGIPLVELLAEKFEELNGRGYKTAEIFELISKRAVPFSMISEIFEDLTDKGGMFYKMQETQAETLRGRWEKLKDAYDIALQSIGDTKTFQNMNDIILKVFKGLADNLLKIIRVVDAGVISWVAYNAVTLLTSKRVQAVATAEQQALIAEAMRSKNVSKLIVKILGQTAAEKALTAATTQATIGTNLFARALGRLKVAILTNPYVAAAAALLGVVLALRRFRDTSNDASDAINGLNKAVDDMHVANKDFSRIETLISKYENLASNTERTESENRTLEKTIKRLAEAFPELEGRINNENLSLEEQVALVKELNRENEQRLKDERTAKQQDLLAAERQLSKAESERDEKKQAKDDATVYYNELSASLEALEAKGKKRSSFLFRMFFGRTEYDWLEPGVKQAERKMNKANKEYAEAEDVVKSFEESIKSLRREIFGFTSDELTGWQEKIRDIQKQMIPHGEQVFTPLEIEQLTSAEKVYDGLVQKINDYNKGIEKQQEILKTAKEPSIISNAKDRLKDLKQLKEVAETLWNLFGFGLFPTTNGTGYTQDPFIKKMRDQIKFMKDYQKGYEDLSKYLAKSSALEKQSEIMLSRGLSLGINAADQQRAAENLSEWYEDTINSTFEYLRKNKGVTGSLEQFLSRSITGSSNRDKMLKDFQNLLQSLFDAKTDFDVSQQKKSLEESLKELTEGVKRSETARNFYKNILDLTGDEQLATTLAVSVYGDEGNEFKERMQHQLDKVFESLDWSALPDNLWGQLAVAVSEQDLDFLMANIALFPTEVRAVLKQIVADSQKYNGNILNNYAKLLMKFDEIGQARVDIMNKANKEVQDIRDGLELEIKGIEKAYPDGAERNKHIADAEARASAVIEAIRRQEAVDLSRLERDYRLFFSSVGVISEQSARKVAANQRRMLTEQFEKGEISLSKFKRELNEVDKQLEKYTMNKGVLATYLTGGISGLTEKFNEYSEGLYALSDNIKGEGGLLSFTEEDKAYLDEIAKVFGGGIFGEFVSGRKNVFQQILDKFGEIPESFQSALDEAAEKIATTAMEMKRGMMWADFWVGFAGGSIKAFDEIAEYSKNTEGEVAEGWNRVAKFILGSAAGMLTGTPITAGMAAQMWELDDAWERFTALNENAMSGFEKFKSGDIIGAIVDNIKGWAEIFGINTKKIDRQLKAQSRLLENLEYQYSRLEVAKQKAFGSEYIETYNRQVATLTAEAEAYRKQAELERSKGKKADEEAARNYDKSARDATDKLEDMRSQLSEFFLGTDLTSAARDFATAWIDAYKQFSSTTDALKEKFADMIESMVTESLAARLVQQQLEPIFKLVDDLAGEGGQLSVMDAALIASRTKETVGTLNTGLTNLMNSLSDVGINVRTMGTGLTGIAKDIQGASEESILGLAAGVNTQNFYMQRINSAVQQILLKLGGPASDTADTGVLTQYTNTPEFSGRIRTIDENLAELLRVVNSVITPKSASTNTHVVAIK